MNELRRDYLLDRWVIIAENRSKRPSDFVERVEAKKRVDPCPFCPGNEAMTPPEIARVRADGGWRIRCFPNKYPVVSPEFSQSAAYSFKASPALGKHEVIVETPEHGKSLGDLKTNEIEEVLAFYAFRVTELGKERGVKHVLIFKNEGPEAGASLDHTHTQVLALPEVPPLVRQEVEASEVWFAEKGCCPFCEILKVEAEGPRSVWKNVEVLAFSPFAARFPFEVWIFPKRHLTSLEELVEGPALRAFASCLKHVLSSLVRLGGPSYNFYFHFSLDGRLHLHLELFPRLTKLAGAELGGGLYINPLPPEVAASFLRG